MLGALNVYAHGRDVFDGHAVAMGEAFSPQAAVSVHNAQLLDQAERLVAQRQQALTSRAQIDQAIGVMMSRTGDTAQEAFDKLRALSQTQSVELTDLAQKVLSGAVQRAQTRKDATPSEWPTSTRAPEHPTSAPPSRL